MEIAVRHVLDSLSAVPLLDPGGGGAAASPLVDLGSGGGFPGLPLAAALPELRLTLVDSVGKKAAFLRTVVGATGLAGRADVDLRRAEALANDPGMRGRAAVVTARAVGTLADLVELAFPLLAPGGRLIAWKRGDLGSELTAASRAALTMGEPRGVRDDLIEVHEVPIRQLAGHRLIVVTKRNPTPAGYPRDPAARRRDPW